MIHDDSGLEGNKYMHVVLLVFAVVQRVNLVCVDEGEEWMNAARQ